MRTFVEMQWHPQLENGELLSAAETAGFDVMVTSDQNIVYQQNLAGRKLALIVLGSNIWPIVRDHGAIIRSKADGAIPGSYVFIEMPLPPTPPKKRQLMSRRNAGMGSVRDGGYCDRTGRAEKFASDMPFTDSESSAASSLASVSCAGA